MFDDVYVANLPHDSLLALEKVTSDFIDAWKAIPLDHEDEFVDNFLSAYAIAKQLVRKVGTLHVDSPDLSGGERNAIKNIGSYMSKLSSLVSSMVFELKAANYLNRYEAILGDSFVYEFSEGDLKRIQKLLNELRDMISGALDFDPSHKARLLARLEKLQTELHKKVADLDRFWGLIGDAGVALGKFGNDAKPFVDRIKEITDIVWRTQARCEELPSDEPMKLLIHDDIQ